MTLNNLTHKFHKNESHKNESHKNESHKNESHKNESHKNNYKTQTRLELDTFKFYNHMLINMYGDKLHDIYECARMLTKYVINKNYTENVEKTFISLAKCVISELESFRNEYSEFVEEFHRLVDNAGILHYQNELFDEDDEYYIHT